MSLDAKADSFKTRRKHFMERIAAGATAILPSAPVAIRSGDVEFIYRQDSDFYYLTGFAEPESVAVFSPGHPDGEFVLFVRPRDRERETWTGRRAGIEGAMIDHGADKAYTIDELEKILPRYLEKSERVHYPLGLNEKFDERVLKMVRWAQAMRPRLGVGPTVLIDPRDIIHEARLMKEEAEIAAMRRAMEISREAHRQAMLKARGGMKEWQIEAEVNYAFRSQGAAGPSYPTIIASGPNAATLHYIQNDREMRTGELLLIDAGAEYDYYAADITRTSPIGAKFTQLQRDLYQVVLDAQLKAIDVIKPGARFDDPHNVALRVLVDGMRGLGMLQGSADEILESASYRRFYMHRTSHWLGMDVHDVGLYRVGGASRVLEPGMVLTVEPGLYIDRDDDTVPESFRGIGIRIEDDILVTANGHEVMTAATPKTIADVEALTAG
ncbi:MAG: aminopeptidase P N-terminal domain-containing protein [Candidatus Binatus sp.]|uniref:aminopeptidase P N-terminal domain-containing protein n=1 Tax=Candidatus Binatus sp. TaxID=2811406 RepID=UPI002726D53E|nr:aminopeptidase P N-terminal domain-containing protein [Candidatus Binatus sp.]MDO8434804.1 aminopeptidase P N-terminal domain-containing protein [Candidatus Binatus sp.]